MEQPTAQRRGFRIPTLCLLAVLLTACGGDDDDTTGTSSPDTNPPAASNPSEPPPPEENAPPSPTISGSPQSTALAGQSYAFEPSASTSGDAETLSFSVVSLPAWASFDPATGRLSGTPEQSHLGLYEDITISVTDGSGTAMLDSFSINVVDMGQGAVTLSWEPPTENEDGTPLNGDLAGYRLYYGHVTGEYEESIDLGNGLTTHTVDGLIPTTYYFAITAYNTAGLESQYSNEAVATVDET